MRAIDFPLMVALGSMANVEMRVINFPLTVALGNRLTSK